MNYYNLSISSDSTEGGGSTSGIPSSSVNIDFTVAQQNNVYTVPSGKKFYPETGILLTDTITGTSTPPTYKWLADSTDLMTATVATMSTVNDGEVDILDSKFYPAGTIIKMEVTSAGTSTTHTGKAILRGVLINV